MEKVKKRKKYVVSLDECEMRRLSAYAAECGVERPAALMRLIRQSLRQVSASSSMVSDNENQLRLFDTVQIDIFNNTTKTTNNE